MFRTPVFLSSNKVRHQLLESQTAHSLQSGGLTVPTQCSHVTCSLIGLRFGTESRVRSVDCTDWSLSFRSGDEDVRRRFVDT